MGPAAFDPRRPPDLGLIDDCVHCGFCLPTCPTYLLWNEEMDSPRGRIVLMGAGLEDGSAMSGEMVAHFDACLGCMACVTACPSGVRYDHEWLASAAWPDGPAQRRGSVSSAVAARASCTHCVARAVQFIATSRCAEAIGAGGAESTIVPGGHTVTMGR